MATESQLTVRRSKRLQALTTVKMERNDDDDDDTETTKFGLGKGIKKNIFRVKKGTTNTFIFPMSILDKNVIGQYYARKYDSNQKNRRPGSDSTGVKTRMKKVSIRRSKRVHKRSAPGVEDDCCKGKKKMVKTNDDKYIDAHSINSNNNKDEDDGKCIDVEDEKKQDVVVSEWFVTREDDGLLNCAAKIMEKENNKDGGQNHHNHIHSSTEKNTDFAIHKNHDNNINKPANVEDEKKQDVGVSESLVTREDDGLLNCVAKIMEKENNKGGRQNHHNHIHSSTEANADFTINKNHDNSINKPDNVEDEKKQDVGVSESFVTREDDGLLNCVAKNMEKENNKDGGRNHHNHIHSSTEANADFTINKNDNDNINKPDNREPTNTYHMKASFISREVTDYQYSDNETVASTRGASTKTPKEKKNVVRDERDDDDDEEDDRGGLVFFDLTGEDRVVVRRRIWLGSRWSPWEDYLSIPRTAIVVNNNNNNNHGARNDDDNTKKKKKMKTSLAKSHQSFNEPLEIQLSRGGKVVVYPNMVDQQTCDLLQEEVLGSGLFRQYVVQNNDEPRSHFLLHQDATQWSDPCDMASKDASLQPGYRYATHTTIKAQPLRLLPLLEEASKYFGEVCIPGQSTKWSIGVNPVLYRDGQDKMGQHSDNDQGEEIILAVLVSDPTHSRIQEGLKERRQQSVNEELAERTKGGNKSSAELRRLKPRRVTIRPAKQVNGKKRELCKGDEWLELYLQPGDAYMMDGVMQGLYTHGVPADKGSVSSSHTTNGNNSNGGGSQRTVKATGSRELDDSNHTQLSADVRRNQRMTIVFRTGQQQDFRYDSGRCLPNLFPRIPRQQIFGNPPEMDLEEGKLYSRMELYQLNAHIQQQSGVGGNAQKGCTSIIVSGKRDDSLGEDVLFGLLYVAERRKGGAKLMLNKDGQLPVRIFRSSEYGSSPYKATKTSSNWDRAKIATTAYRYDGLYEVVYSQVEAAEKDDPRYYSVLRRLGCQGFGDGHHFRNKINDNDYLHYCTRLKNTMLLNDDDDNTKALRKDDDTMAGIVQHWLQLVCAANYCPPHSRGNISKILAEETIRVASLMVAPSPSTILEDEAEENRHYSINNRNTAVNDSESLMMRTDMTRDDAVASVGQSFVDLVLTQPRQIPCSQFWYRNEWLSGHDYVHDGTLMNSNFSFCSSGNGCVYSNGTNMQRYDQYGRLSPNPMVDISHSDRRTYLPQTYYSMADAAMTMLSMNNTVRGNIYGNGYILPQRMYMNTTQQYTNRIADTNDNENSNHGNTNVAYRNASDVETDINAVSMALLCLNDGSTRNPPPPSYLPSTGCPRPDLQSRVDASMALLRLNDN